MNNRVTKLSATYNISTEDANKLVLLDPTKNKEYFEFLAKQYKEGNLQLDDESVKDTLTQHLKIKKKLNSKDKDILKLSLPDLNKLVEGTTENDLNRIYRSEDGHVKIYKIGYNDFKEYRRRFGHTSWCTTTEETFDEYLGKSHLFVIDFRGELLQYDPSTNSIKDALDKDPNKFLMDEVKKYEAVRDALCPIESTGENILQLDTEFDLERVSRCDQWTAFSCAIWFGFRVHTIEDWVKEDLYRSYVYDVYAIQSKRIACNEYVYHDGEQYILLNASLTDLIWSSLTRERILPPRREKRMLEDYVTQDKYYFSKQLYDYSLLMEGNTIEQYVMMKNLYSGYAWVHLYSKKPNKQYEGLLLSTIAQNRERCFGLIDKMIEYCNVFNKWDSFIEYLTSDGFRKSDMCSEFAIQSHMINVRIASCKHEYVRERDIIRLEEYLVSSNLGYIIRHVPNAKTLYPNITIPTTGSLHLESITSYNLEVADLINDGRVAWSYIQHLIKRECLGNPVDERLVKLIASIGDMLEEGHIQILQAADNVWSHAVIKALLGNGIKIRFLGNLVKLCKTFQDLMEYHPRINDHFLHNTDPTQVMKLLQIVRHYYPKLDYTDLIQQMPLVLDNEELITKSGTDSELLDYALNISKRSWKHMYNHDKKIRDECHNRIMTYPYISRDQLIAYFDLSQKEP